MRITCFTAVTLLLMNVSQSQPIEEKIPLNREPLLQNKFAALPLGAVKPRGWLKDQLRVQADGLTGHLDEFWPSLSESAWDGGEGEAWERGPYYLDGLVPLAYLLEDERLIAKAQKYIDWILSSGRPDGWFGPTQNRDRWPLAVALKVLTQYHEATGDTRVLSLMAGYFRYLKENPPDWPDREWRGVRAMEHLVSIYWLHRRTGDVDLPVVAESIYKNCYDWTGYFLDFPYTNEVLEKGIQYGHPSHVVNIAMALKYPGLIYQHSHNERHKRAVYEGLASLYKYHGQAAGRFSGDEHLSGRHPSQGTELCGVVEQMFSLENLIEIFGDVEFCDRLELLAYNANPGTCTADYWAHQYDQQANQVLCTMAKRNWSTNNDDSNLYGLEPNYGCCTSNMHQGWPKFVSRLWMATPNGGLAATAYGPSEVRATVAGEVQATIQEETEYPFDGDIRFTVGLTRAAEFPIYLRVPAWAEGAEIRVGRERIPAAPNSFAVIHRVWNGGDRIELRLPMRLRTERRYNNAVSILRGPVYFSLRIGERRRERARHSETFPAIDWEVYPTTPWNYGLVLDPAHPEKSMSVKRQPVGEVPFETDAAPVVLKVKGRTIPEWVQVDNSAGAPPASPVVSDAPRARLELVPYGSTRLRITEFPIIEKE